MLLSTILGNTIFDSLQIIIEFALIAFLLYKNISYGLKKVDIFIICWIQVVSATLNDSPKNTSLGVLYPSLFLGRLLILFMAWINSLSVMVLKSLFLGKYCRMRPLVFSLVPLSQEEYA